MERSSNRRPILVRTRAFASTETLAYSPHALGNHHQIVKSLNCAKRKRENAAENGHVMGKHAKPDIKTTCHSCLLIAQRKFKQLDVTTTVTSRQLRGLRVREIADGASGKEFQTTTQNAKCTKKRNYVKFDLVITTTNSTAF